MRELGERERIVTEAEFVKEIALMLQIYVGRHTRTEWAKKRIVPDLVAEKSIAATLWEKWGRRVTIIAESSEATVAPPPGNPAAVPRS